MANKKPQPLDQKQFEATKQWFKQNSKSMPLEVKESFQRILDVYTCLGSKDRGYTNVLALLHKEMGILPKKDGFSEAELSIDDKINAATKALDRQAKNLARYKERLRALKAQKKSSKSKSTKKDKKNELTPMLENAKDAMHCTGSIEVTEEDKMSSIDKKTNFENPKGLHSVYNTTTRYNFDIVMTKQIHKIETVTDMRTGKSVTASTEEYGPKGFQVTWNAIAMMVIMTISYAMPTNRLSSLLSTADKKIFSSTSILKHLKYAANILEPIYYFLAKTIANAAIWYGDDTTANVAEMKKLALDDETLKKTEISGLVEEVEDYLGRTYNKKNGTGLKKKVNISAIAGKEDPMDARSYIFLYRTHFGSVGNLADSLLKMRKPEMPRLTFLGDLSTTNYPSLENQKKFSIDFAGCSAHARRPFWRYLDTDQDLCAYFLRAFLLISTIENRLVEMEANITTIKRFRERYTAKVYSYLLKISKMVITQDPKSPFNTWQPNSEIYNACAYIVNNYDKITKFIHDPRLPSTNNLMERVLRPEALYKSSSKQTKTEEGRVVLDILRTILVTAMAAKIDVKKYLIWVFINHKDVKINPQNYTPYAYAKLQPST